MGAPWVVHVPSALLVIMTTLIVVRNLRNRRAVRPPILLKDVLFVQSPLFLLVAITLVLGKGFGQRPAPLWQFAGILVAVLAMLILHRRRFYSWW